MIIDRKITNLVIEKIKPGRVVVLYGPRRSGKTTVLMEIAKQFKNKPPVLWLDGDDIRVKRNLSSQDSDQLKQFIGSSKLVIIDEAQRITNIGINLKIIVDNLDDVSIIASGSASFDLANKINEPLTGRKRVLYLFPLSMEELIGIEEQWKVKEKLSHWLIWGGYPEVFLAKTIDEKKEAIMEIVSSYLYKDILEYEGIRRSGKILNLLKLVALQIGAEVSISELANNLNMDFRTVERYLDLLEKSFVIYSIRGFSRNLRKEVNKMAKYYFFDNGVRNALIENFNDLSLRSDPGQLWENWLMIERQKKLHYKSITSSRYFWRTYDKKEIDLIEERDGKLYGFEFKWGNKKVKPPKDWLSTYKQASFKVIDRENYFKFIS